MKKMYWAAVAVISIKHCNCDERSVVIALEFLVCSSHGLQAKNMKLLQLI